jgi:hypothetical protein
LQHTPEAQNPLAHSTALAQLDPSARFGSQATPSQ